MLDFTKFGILLGIRCFTKKKTTFYQSWELGIFSCETIPDFALEWYTCNKQKKATSVQWTVS